MPENACDSARLRDEEQITELCTRCLFAGRRATGTAGDGCAASAIMATAFQLGRGALLQAPSSSLHKQGLQRRTMIGVRATWNEVKNIATRSIAHCGYCSFSRRSPAKNAAISSRGNARIARRSSFASSFVSRVGPHSPLPSQARTLHPCLFGCTLPN